RAAVRGDTDSAMTPFEQGLAEQRRGNLGGAEAIYRTILPGDANHFAPIHMLATLCTESGKHAEAEQLFRRAVAIDARYPPCRYNFGLFYAKSGQYQNAIAEFDRALALHPNFAPVYVDRGSARK